MAVKNDLKKLRKEQRFVLQHILKSLWKISSIWTLKKINPKEGGAYEPALSDYRHRFWRNPLLQQLAGSWRTESTVN